MKGRRFVCKLIAHNPNKKKAEGPKPVFSRFGIGIK
jgi:hypothetical protein